MSNEYHTFVEILKGQPEYRMSRVDLSKEMSRRRAMGFGVEIDDIISVFVEKGLANYDHETDTVTYTQ